jgi:hypothetical protein
MSLPPLCLLGSYGGVVGWGTALQVGMFLWPCGCTMALGSTRLLGAKGWRYYGWLTYHLHVPVGLKYESLNLLEPSRPVPSGALAPGADFEGAPKRRSPTGHTLILSTVEWWFPHLQTKKVAKDFFKFGCIGFSLLWCVLVFTYICIFTLCFMFIAANIVYCRLTHQDVQCTHR